MKGFIIVLSVLLLFGCGDKLHAACSGSHPNLTAASCNSIDVSACVTASSDGDTITIPPGSCTWSSQVAVDASAKELHLVGSGESSTIITPSVDAALSITGGLGKQFTVSNIQFAGGSGDSIITVSGTSQNFRLHHITFNSSGGATALIKVVGYTYGLIDHCTVMGHISEFVAVDGDNWVGWLRSQSFGDANAVYIEDNTITWTSDFWIGRPAHDGERAGRTVFRYNTVTNARYGGHGFDSGNCAGILSTEVYNNSFIFNSLGGGTNWDYLSGIRSGTSLWHDNTWTIGNNVEVTNKKIMLRDYRAEGITPDSDHYRVCNGSPYMMCSNVDKNWNFLGGNTIDDCREGTNSDCYSGYTCKWKFCSGNKVRLCDPANVNGRDYDCTSGGHGNEGTCTEYVDGTGTGGYPCFMQNGFSTGMVSSPSYQWNNTYTGSTSPPSPSPGTVVFGTYVTQIQANRDYFDATKSGYTPYVYPHPLQGSSGSGSTTILGNGASYGNGAQVGSN